MKKFLRKMLDSGDREIEAHLVCLAVGAATLIALSIYHVVALHAPFEPESFGQGLGYLFTGGGAAAWGQGMQRKADGSNESDQ